MTAATSTVLNRAGEELGGFLPRAGGAIALLLLGLLAAWVIGAVVRRALRALGADDLGERWDIHDVLERMGTERSLSRIVGRAVRLTLSIVAILAALSLLGLQFLSESLNKVVLFLPNLLVALALVLAGIVLAGLARRRVDRLAYQMDLPIPLGKVAEVAIIAVFVITAAAQIAISTAILMGLVGILLAAVAATFAIAFGLGGRGVARELSAGRYVASAFDVGQTLSVEGVRGRVVALEATTTVLRTDEGATVRVPNNLLLERIVTVHDGGEGVEA